MFCRWYILFVFVCKNYVKVLGKKKKWKNNKIWFVVILIDLIEIKKKKIILRINLIIKCFFECKYGSDLFNNRG